MAENQTKISFRFYRNRQVRAVWDETAAKWWFSVIDIIAALNAQDDYTKTRNYWKYLEAIRQSVADSAHIKSLIKPALTDKINDREIFMKGIDYSYYYEQND